MEPPEPVSGRVIPPTAGISLRREVPAFFVPPIKTSGVLHLSLTAKVMFPVAVQSRWLILALVLLPADPAGAKPQRDPRFF